MKIFIQSHDYDLWKIIINGSHIPKALKEHDKKMAQLNAKAMNILYCSLELNVFNAISSYISAKHVWEKLERIYEGANQIEESSS